VIRTALACFLVASLILGKTVAPLAEDADGGLDAGMILPNLIVPVVGVERATLRDTWREARAAGRVHQGIDIPAESGTPVLASGDGKVAKLFLSERGGYTLYQFDPSETWVYYYAHLQSYAADIAEGDELRQGALIGYVGSSGNARTPHLHFEIGRLGTERRWWVSEPINPYWSLTAGLPRARTCEFRPCAKHDGEGFDR